jgi:hypothetical protein
MGMCACSLRFFVWSIHEYFQFSSIRKGKNLAWARYVLRVQIVRNTVLKPQTVTGRLIAKNRFPIRGQVSDEMITQNNKIHSFGELKPERYCKICTIA